MRRSFGFLAVFLCMALMALPALAQAYPVFHPVGQCFVKPPGQAFAQGFLVQEQWFQGRPSWGMRSPINGPLLQAFPVVPDPSGIHFLAVASGVPGSRFWVTWDMKVVQVTWQGQSAIVGDCSMLPAFVSKFYRPAPPQPPQWATASFGFSGPSLQPSDAVLTQVKVPNEIMAGVEDQEFARPLGLTMTAAQAGACQAKANNDQDRFYECMLLANMGTKERATYECMKGAGDDTQRVSLCLVSNWSGLKDNTVAKQALRCYEEHGTKWDVYPLCMAGQASSKDVQDLVACARQNFSGGATDAWGMAACYGGPKLLEGMNPESMIAAQCALQSGGNPKVFAACAGGQLTTRELDKCLSHGVGGAKGCFGDNNTITQGFRAAEDEIVRAFGKDSPLHLAWRAATMSVDPNQAAKVANDVAREATVAAKNVEKEASKAAQNVAKETELAAQKVARVMPRIKVKRIKITW